MNLTTLLGLGKPLVGENYDIAVPNNNMDLVDAAVAADRARLTAIESPAVLVPKPARVDLGDYLTPLTTANTYVVMPSVAGLVFTVPTGKPLMCQINFASWMKVIGSANCETFLKLVGSGATVFDSATDRGNNGEFDFWTPGTAVQHIHHASFSLVLSPGVTTIKPWLKRSTSVTTQEYKGVYIECLPIRWASEYENGGV